MGTLKTGCSECIVKGLGCCVLGSRFGSCAGNTRRVAKHEDSQIFLRGEVEAIAQTGLLCFYLFSFQWDA